MTKKLTAMFFYTNSGFTLLAILVNPYFENLNEEPNGHCVRNIYIAITKVHQSTYIDQNVRSYKQVSRKSLE